MSTDNIYCCEELKRHHQAPKDDDRYVVAYIPAPGFGWLATDMTESEEERDTYNMGDECIFCKKKLEVL